MPHIFKYPSLLKFTEDTPIRDIFCYVIKHYGKEGISVVVKRDAELDQTGIVFGDWKGNIIDLNDTSKLSDKCKNFAENEMINILKAMRLIGINQAQYFFSVINDELTLCDIQLSINKMAGPGMVRDIFGKMFKTQEVLKTEIIDLRAISALIQGTGSYEGDIIIKPSRFRLDTSISSKNNPLYVELVR